MKNLAVQVAIPEIANPTHGVTEQILAVHTLVMQDDKPSILLIDQDSEPGSYYIYFSIKDEPYHLVIVIREEEGKLVASAVYIEAFSRVYLSISSTTLHPDSITEKVKLNPSKIGVKGETRRPQTPVKWENNRWYFEPQHNVPGSLENKLNFLLDQLEPEQLRISTLQNECEICICIYYAGYCGWMGGWHIDNTTMSRIVTLGASVDLDLNVYGDHDLPLL